MDDKKAWELVMSAAEKHQYHLHLREEPEQEELYAALAHLQGKHAYFSRFTPDDTVWYIGRFGDPEVWRVGGLGSFTTALSIPERCFPTREEAQAECDKRNKEGE